MTQRAFPERNLPSWALVSSVLDSWAHCLLHDATWQTFLVRPPRARRPRVPLDEVRCSSMLSNAPILPPVTYPTHAPLKSARPASCAAASSLTLSSPDLSGGRCTWAAGLTAWNHELCRERQDVWWYSCIKNVLSGPGL
ncbi:hypothetical protein BD309DRAFT_720220 [Dichomitus squalens]|nr:hypothetical protein BD309DRAFT_720220 [Dichomitus squalens]